MNSNPIASELSYLVLLKRQREQQGRDVPKVKAPVERPARFDGYPVAVGRVESGQIVTVGR